MVAIVRAATAAVMTMVGAVAMEELLAMTEETEAKVKAGEEVEVAAIPTPETFGTGLTVAVLDTLACRLG